MVEGICVAGHCVHTQVWAKNITKGFAVILFNRAQLFDFNANLFSAEDVVLSWSDLGIPVCPLFFLNLAMITTW